MDTPFLIHLTDTRITQYVIHAEDSGEAIRDCWSRGIPVYCTGEVRAQAIPITESQYDEANENKAGFQLVAPGQPQ